MFPLNNLPVITNRNALTGDCDLGSGLLVSSQVEEIQGLNTSANSNLASSKTCNNIVRREDRNHS
jgi:hypothetical protein